MSVLAELRERRAGVWGDIEKSLAESADEGMNGEQAERHAALEAEFGRLDGDIKARERAERIKDDLAKPRDVPDGVGPAPSRSDEQLKNDKAYEKAFNKYLRRGQDGLGTYERDLLEQRAQTVGTPSEGGYTVPDGFLTKLVDVRKAYGGLATAAQEITTSTGQPLEFPSLDDTANVGGITPESAAFVDGADLAFGTVTLGAYKFTSTGGGTTTPLRVSYELLQDSAFDVEALISRKLGERIARKQADAWVNGAASGDPQGIAGASITENLDVDVHDVIDYDDLLDMEGRLDPEYEANAKWAMSKSTWSVIRGITVDGRPLVQPAAVAGIGTRPEYLLLGYPIIIDQAMPTFPGAGNEKFIALGDWMEAYLIRRVAGLSIVVNPYSRANNGEVEFTAWERADGVVQNRSAFVLMANTAS